MTPYQTFWKLLRARPWVFLGDTTMITVFYLLIGLNGLIIRAYFDYLTGSASAGWNLNSLLALLVGLATGRVTTLFIAGRLSGLYEIRATLLIGRNVLHLSLIHI